jgi:hypothetical protein
MDAVPKFDEAFERNPKISGGQPVFESYATAKEQLFDYIEVFYNQQRRHSSLDYVSPGEYERAARAA